jgi:hypothetical protein
MVYEPNSKEIKEFLKSFEKYLVNEDENNYNQKIMKKLD